MDGLQKGVGFIILTFGLLFTFFLVGFLANSGPGSGGRTAEELRLLIDEKLPQGSSLAQVVAFLDAEKLNHDEKPDETGILLASAPSKSWVLIGESRIILHFAFDNGKLSRFSVEERTFGP